MGIFDKEITNEIYDGLGSSKCCNPILCKNLYYLGEE
jgi:hypothetical protein